MKLRHLLTPVAVAAFAVAPVAATTAANAAVPTNHNQTFKDTDEVTPANQVNIVKTHVFRTANDFRAVVNLKSYTALKNTRYNVAFLSDGENSNGNLVDLRINSSGTPSVLAYGVAGETLVKSNCQGVRVFSGTNSLTFVIPNKCWYSETAPTYVITGTKHYLTSAAYAKGSPIDTLSTESESSNSDSSDNDSYGGWDWGGPTLDEGDSGKGTRPAPGRLHL